MNERMYELLAQARNQPVDVVKRAPYGSCILTPAQLEKYTELVMQECAEITKQHFVKMFLKNISELKNE